MSTDKNNKADKAYYHFYAGLNQENQKLLAEVKVKMAYDLGPISLNLDVMLELMRTYLKQSTP